MKNTIVMSILPVLFTLQASCRSVPDIDVLEIKAMTTAQTAPGLRAQLVQLDQLATDELACRLQLKDNTLPYGCYKARQIRLTNRWPTKANLYRNLNKKCERIATKTKELDWRHLSELSSRCRIVARKQIRINRYKAGKSWQGF